jgi:hypothetical protein
MVFKAFFEKIDLSKRFPGYFNKKLLNFAFIIVAIVQMTALSMTGFNFYPAWFECQRGTCENPFYQAPENFCAKNGNLCDSEIISAGEIVGEKPNAFVINANLISWIILFIAFGLNHWRYVYGKKRK